MKTQLLANVPAFTGLSENQLDVLARSLGEQRLERNTIAFHQGSAGSVLYIIVEGQMRIYTISPLGQELTISILCAGEFFGEMALLDGLPRAASAQAMTPTYLLTLHRQAFLHTINTCPAIAASILEVMAARLRQSNAYAEQLAAMPAGRRVVNQIVGLAQRHAAGRTAIDLHLTQDDLASMSGTSRETVNRVLSNLRDRGLVVVERARVHVPNLPKLRKELDED